MLKRHGRRGCAYPEGRTKSFDVSFVHFTDTGECRAQHGVIVFVNSFFDEVWRFVLELFVSREVVACFFCTEERPMSVGALKPAGINSLPSHHDRDLIYQTHLLQMLHILLLISGQDMPWSVRESALDARTRV